jgi:hypothetical protein
MSLWGTKKDNDGEDEVLRVNGEGEAADAAPRTSHEDARPRSRREPNERDRLLGAHHNNPPHSDGYLDPDDPAV